jgi:hypothetical protein
MSDFTEADVVVRTGHLHMGLVKWAPDEKSAEILKRNEKAQQATKIVLMTVANAISQILNADAPTEEATALLESFQKKVEELAESIGFESRQIERLHNKETFRTI